MNKFMFLRLFGLVWIVGGVVLLVLLSYTFLKQQKASTWPTVEGVVKTSEVIRQETFVAGKRGPTYYCPKIEYQYTVANTSFESNRVCFFDVLQSKWEPAMAQAALYPLNSHVTVYYNPNCPSECVLQTDIPKLFLWSSIIPLALLIGGIAIFRYSSMGTRLQ